MERDEADYLTVPEVTRILRLRNTYTVRRWIQAGVLEAEKVIEGKRHRYRIKRTVIDTMQERSDNQNE